MIATDNPVRILVVDDEGSCRLILRKVLEQQGYQCDTTEDGLSALDKIQASPFDLLISDIKMPGMDGLELVAKVRESDQDMAVIMVTAFATFSSAIEALKLGANDYLTKPFDLEHVLLCVERVLDRRRLVLENQRYREHLEEQVQEQTRQIRTTLEDLERAYIRTKEANRHTCFVLSKAAETNDELTGMHIKRVGVFAITIAAHMGLDEEGLERLSYSSELHDVGKVAVHPDILRKPGKLTAEEFADMKLHTLRGAQILDGVEFLATAKEVAVGHHERYDGNGYPHGLAGTHIPIAARITAIADVFDAITSDRHYRPAMSVDTALDIIRDERGKQFDPEVYDAFFQVIDDIIELKRMHEG